MADELRFDGRAVVVTGAGRGFGRCHALQLAARGAKVVVADLGVNMDGTGSSSGPAEDVVREIEAAGGEAVAAYADVTDEQAAAGIIGAAIDNFGRIDVVVNNAGIVDHAWFEDLSTDQFRRQVEVHYLGTVNVTKAAWAHFIEAGYGRIVNTTSEAILGNVPKSTNYSGAKGAVWSFTRALTIDALRHRDIRVNAIAPRGNTRMSQSSMLAYTYDLPEDTFKGQFFDQMTPEKTSHLVAFLAHESCPVNGEIFMTGMDLVQRIATIQTKGFESATMSAEEIAANFDTVMDVTDAPVITSGPIM